MVVARVVANRMLIGGYGDGVGDASVTSGLAVVFGGYVCFSTVERHFGAREGEDVPGTSVRTRRLSDIQSQ